MIMSLWLAALLMQLAPVHATERPLVMVSIPPQKYLVEALAGDSVEVEVLLPGGSSPATYEPTPRQLVSLDRARLYLQIGVPFEGPLIEKAAGLMPDLRIVDCRAGVKLVPVAEGGHSHGAEHLDPHIWLDPRRMVIIATTTAGAIRALDPSTAPAIDRNLETLRKALGDVDKRVASLLKPFEGSEVLVFHPAYGYFTRRYGLRQVAVEEEGKAPSARRLASIIQSVGGRGVPAIFVQPQFSTAAAQRVADALGCELMELDPLAEDWPANMETMAIRIATALGK
jgi:zinc transport system substrate-binding protein